MTSLNLLRMERLRQMRDKGYSADHDDQHICGEIAYAASCYAKFAGLQSEVEDTVNIKTDSPYEDWPWNNTDWKPAKERVRNLVKAGALICAEIDRLMRIEEHPFTPTPYDIAAARKIIEQGSL